VRIVGWRGLFDYIAIAGMILLALYWRFSGHGHGTEGRSPRASTTWRHFRDRRFWLVASIQFVRLAVAVGVTFWIPAFLIIDRGLSLEVVGPVIAIGAVATAVSNFVGGYLSDRSRRPRLVIGLSLTVLAITIAAIAVVESIPLLLGIVAVNAFFIQLYFGPLFALPVALLGRSTAGVTTGAGNLTANLGGLASVLVLGALRDATGSFTLGFALLSALCVLGVSFTWLIGRSARSSIVAA
jgi:predicted MFS family arabinose efflux permease